MFPEEHQWRSWLVTFLDQSPMEIMLLIFLVPPVVGVAMLLGWTLRLAAQPDAFQAANGRFKLDRRRPLEPSSSPPCRICRVVCGIARTLAFPHCEHFNRLATST